MLVRLLNLNLLGLFDCMLIPLNSPCPCSITGMAVPPIFTEQTSSGAVVIIFKMPVKLHAIMFCGGLWMILRNYDVFCTVQFLLGVDALCCCRPSGSASPLDQLCWRHMIRGLIALFFWTKKIELTVQGSQFVKWIHADVKMHTSGSLLIDRYVSLPMCRIEL